MKRESVIAWALCLLVFLGAIVQLVVWQRGLSAPPAAFEVVRTLGWQLVVPVVFAVTGALIIARQPRNRVGWLLMLPALVTAVYPQQYLAVSRPELTPGLWLLLWFAGWSWIVTLFPMFLIPLHFPTGRPPSPRWRWVNWLALTLWVLFMISVAFDDMLTAPYEGWQIANPLSFSPLQQFEGPFVIAWGLGLAIMVAGSLASLFARYQGAGAVERGQIRWLLFAGAFLVLVYGVTYAKSGSGGETLLASGWAGLLQVLALLTFAAAAGFAILRYPAAES